MRNAFFLALGLSSAFAPIANAQQAAGGLKLPGAREDTYIMQGFHTPDDWQFVLGPKNAPSVSMKLVKATTKGSIGFLCKQADGVRVLGVTFVGLKEVPGTVLPVTFTLAGASGTVPMTATASQSSDTTFTVDDDHATTLLQVMSQASGPTTGTLTLDDSKGHSMQVPVPDPVDISLAAEKVCNGWHAKVEANRPPDPSKIQSLGNPIP